MCTTGAKVLAPGKEFVLFKNRDFKRGHFDDRVSITERAFGVLGLETWDGLDPAQDRFSGFSIGCNEHLACCDSNVKTVERGENYDRLVQAVVENCSTIDEAVRQVRALVEAGSYCWANVLVATPNEVAAVEVRDGQIGVERNPAGLARANHHICLGANADDDDTVTTPVRYDLAANGLRRAQDLTDIFKLLRIHAPEREYGICNHGLYETVYSYVIHWREGKLTFYVYQGHPCEGGAYRAIPITFGQQLDLSQYPSNRAVHPL
jgi:hypothetical protein